MEQATYPSKRCREPIFGPHGMAYPCEVVLLHPGPCASFSLKESVERRDAWETDHPEWRSEVGTLDDLV